MAGTVTLPEASIRRSGKQLAWLAILGQILIAISLATVPLVLYSIAKLGDSELRFMPFLLRLVTDPVTNGPANLCQLILAAGMLLVLECVRRWGNALASPEPTGKTTLTAIGWLQISILLLGLLDSFDVRIEHGFRYWPCTAGDACMTHALEWGWSVTPIYVAALVVVVLSIARRLVSQAQVLKAENEGFV
jgi:hypothetical protein